MEKKAAPIFFFAPFVSSAMPVEPHWLDHGRMASPYVHFLFDQGLQEALLILKAGAEEEETSLLKPLHSRSQYFKEPSATDTVRMTLQLLDFDESHLHVWLELRQGADGVLAASSEMMLAHVDAADRSTLPFPASLLGNIASMKTAHARLARPSSFERSIGLMENDRLSEFAAMTRH